MIDFLLLLLLIQTPPATFLDQGLASAKEKIAREPNRAEGYNDLAMTLARKERETGDAALLVQAEKAVATSLKLEPANFEGRKARVALRLAQHRYEDALEEAQALNKQTPDDNQLYAFMSEAQVAIGNYPEAEKNAQRMLDLRRVNGPGMERGAILRELFGYPDAALDWWNSSLQLSSDRDTEERAYIHTQIARVLRQQGKYEAATQHTRQALELCPDYPAAVTEAALILVESKKPKEAVALLRQQSKRGSDLERGYLLGRALEAVGEKPEAMAAYADFESRARAEVDAPSNANSLLIRCLADHGKPAEAIAIAAKSLKRRHDLFTTRSYAWALYRNGQADEALRQIQEALKPGLRDSGMYYEAGLIAQRANQLPLAEKFFRTAFEINSTGPHSGEILKQLGSMQHPDAN